MDNVVNTLNNNNSVTSNMVLNTDTNTCISNKKVNMLYKLYLIYSSWKLVDIIDFIKGFYSNMNGEDLNKLIGPIRIDYVSGHQSYRSLILLHKCVYEKLHKEGFTKRIPEYDFRIISYEIRENNYPMFGFSSNLYIPLPSSLNKGNCVHDIKKKLDNLIKYNILSSNSCRILLPLKYDSARGFVGSIFIDFHDSITLEQRAMIRLILNDTKWNVSSITNTFRVKCLWAKERKK